MSPVRWENDGFVRLPDRMDGPNSGDHLSKLMSQDKSRPEPETSADAESFDIPYAGEVTIPSTDEPPAAPPDKKIHRRRPLPPVADRTQPKASEPD